MKFPLRLLLPAVIVLAGCSTHYNLRTVPDFKSAAGGHSVAVVAVDQRDDLLTGEITPNYVGLVRDVAFGIPFRAHTASGAAVVNDLAASIADGLKKDGVNAVFVRNPRPASYTSAFDAALASGKSRILVVKVKSFETSTLIRTDVNCDIVFTVLNRGGHELISNRVNEEFTSKFTITPRDDGQTAITKQLTTILQFAVTPLLPYL